MKNKIKYHIFLALISVFVFSPLVKAQEKNDGSRYAENSKLASGKWIKLKTTENAIYKLSYEDIKKMGISDPAKVKIYGAGGWMLDENFSADIPFVDDLQEVAVYVNKGSDNVFNAGDFLLFYGRGTVKWSYDTDSGQFVHENNPYSTYGAYFMTEGESGPKEMDVLTSVEQTTVTVDEYNDYTVHELDSVTIANTGKELFGESFVTRNPRTFDFNVPGITSADFTLSFAALAPTRSSLTLTANEDEIIDVSESWTGSDGYVKAVLRNFSGTWNNPTEKISAKVYYEIGSQTVAYLNYIRLNTTRKLQFYGNNDPFFRNISLGSDATRFNIENTKSSNVVFDITDPYNANVVNTSLSGTQTSFGVRLNNTIREFAVVDLTQSFLTPELIGVVENQDLHGLEQTDMVILVPKNFLVQAETLAQAHREKSGLHVTVVQADLVFNEFSSGVPDATAYRRFMKMFYDRAETEQEKPKYLLLFGDGVFDNRFKTPGGRNLQKENYLLTYQFKESVNEHWSFGTDDYFGFLDDGEGISIHHETLDLGIGRFPVSTMAQADNAVTKVIGYMNNTQYGAWKNSLVFVGDDRSVGTENTFMHCVGADSLAKIVESSYPEFLVSKVYQPAFRSVTVNGKKTYPDAKNKMMNALEKGCFLINYTGHGSTTSWTSEDLLNMSDINQMSFENLPLWITATCDFGWFDGISNSAGEAAFQNRRSGAIALYTTTRVVYSIDNDLINRKLISILFDKENRRNLRLGDVLKLSKNEMIGNTNKLNYILLGDPALRLNFPDLEVQLSTVNGEPVKEGEKLTFKALEDVTLTGKIVDVNGNVQTGLNGTLQTLVYDSEQQLKSLETDAHGRYLEFYEYTSMVYPPANSSIVNGEFTTGFKVPLDIFYSDNNGKINFYAFDEASKQEAQGSFMNFALNGTSENTENNGEGPEIRAMYLNTPLFKNGDKVNQTPLFVAEVFDEDGINVSGGSIGHDISIRINNNPSYTFSLNSHFIPSMEENGAGRVEFLIPNEKALPDGNHTLVFRVWDLLNNSSTDSIYFTVVKDLRPQLYDLTAIGNPARGNTFFVLSHDRPEAQLDVTIRVYDLTGRICWVNKVSGKSGWLKNLPIEWDLRTNSGMSLKSGAYVYQAEIRCGNSSEVTKAKKIIILGQ